MRKTSVLAVLLALCLALPSPAARAAAEIPGGVTFDLSFTEMVIRDDLIMEPLLKAINEGKLPVYNFQGVAYKPDGQEQRIAFNNAVPNGSFGLQTLTPGEVIEREQSFALNAIPQFIKSLASTYLN